MHFALVLAAALAVAGNGEESLVRLGGPGRHCSWVPQDPCVERSVGALKVTANEKAEKKIGLGGYAFPSYLASEKFTVSFSYRSTVKADLLFRISTMERPKCETWQQKKLKPAADWTEATLTFTSVQQDLYEAGLSLVVAKGAGTFEMKDLIVAEAAPARTDGKAFTVNGTEITSIALMPNDDPMIHRSELRAARMFRYALYLNGGKYLPVKTVASAKDAPAHALLVGLLAKEAGVVAAKPGTAGYVRAAKGGSLGVWGDAPTGNEFGMWRLLQDLGIEYLGADWWYPTADKASFALATAARAENPSVPYRWLPYRAGSQCELRGQDNQFGAFADVGCGSIVHGGGLFWDSLGRIVTPKEFAGTKPEFFALQKDGKRMTKCSVGIEQFCWSNRELQQLVGARYSEMMDVARTAKFFVLAPGDGGDAYCRCEACRKMGRTSSDRMVKFANAVAEITSKRHPDKYIFFYPYADTQEPPDPSVKAHPNVKIALTIYITTHWPSSVIYRTEANELGFESLAGWRKVFPDAGFIGYYDHCNEWLRFWPNFNYVEDLARDFGGHGALMAPRFGLIPSHANGVLPECSSFTSLRIYMTSALEADSRADIRKVVRHYLDGYYGVAAPDMQALVDLAWQEPLKRKWVQGCEQSLYSFMTKDFSLMCLAHLDAAEAKAKAAGDTRLLRRIYTEKQSVLWSYLNDTCRGRGNVVGDDFKPWAKRLAEFCQIARVTRNAYIGNQKMDNWFNAIAFYKVKPLGNYRWTEAPEIDALIADPVKALGEKFPNLQTKVEGGYEIASKGMMGGLMCLGSKWRSTTPVNMLILRRESSTLGLVMTKLELKKAPTADVKMIVTGIGSEKPNDFADMEIVVNGNMAYKGKSAFGGEKHHDVTYTIPAKFFKTGANDISFANVTVDREAKFDGEGGANFRAKRDYNWGWYAIDKLRFEGVE